MADASPTREDLLDIEWLTETYQREGLSKLNLHQTADRMDYIDLKSGLTHLLRRGSWASNPNSRTTRAEGPHNRNCSLWFVPPAKRAEWIGHNSDSPCDHSLPDLAALRLIEPFDCAWAAHTDGIWGCEVSRDGRHMVSASRDGDVAVWDMERGTLVARAKTGEPDVRDCAITRDGTRVISMHEKGPLTVWDLQTMTLLRRLDTPGNSWYRLRRFAVSDDDRLLAIVGNDGIDVWDLQSFERLARLSEPGAENSSLAPAFDSSDRLVCAQRGHSFEIVTWDWRSQRVMERHGFLGPPMDERVNRTSMTPDRRHLVAATDHTTTVWQIGRSLPHSQVPYGTFGEALALSVDGRMAATCNHRVPGKWEPVVRVWSLPDLREIWTLNLFDVGCRDIACALAFTPDARRLVIAGWEGAIRRAVLPAFTS